MNTPLILEQLGNPLIIGLLLAFSYKLGRKDGRGEYESFTKVLE